MFRFLKLLFLGLCFLIKYYNLYILRMFIRALAVTLILTLSLQQSMTSTNSFINQAATYTVTLSVTAAQIPSGGYLLFQLPIDYYSSTNTISTTCTSCTISGGTTIKFNSLTSSSSILTLTITNIINPPMSGYPLFTYSFYDSSNTIIGSVNSFTPIQFFSGSLTSRNLVTQAVASVFHPIQ